MLLDDVKNFDVRNGVSEKRDRNRNGDSIFVDNFVEKS